KPSDARGGPSFKPLHHPAHRRMLPVLHLHPMLAPAALIWAVGRRQQSVTAICNSNLWPNEPDPDRLAGILLRPRELIMRSIALVIAFVVGMAAPAFAQKAEIEAANAKWIEFFNKGDFAGIASLYTADATAFPPGSAMVKGNAAIGAMWKSV